MEVNQGEVMTSVELMEEYLRSIGLDLDSEHLSRTPERIVRSHQNELFSGLGKDPREPLRRQFDDDESLTDQFVIVDNIEVKSMCAHHFLPFKGVAHVGYIPDNAVVGLSKLARVVDRYARRPQVQERLTNQIADAVHEELEPIATVVYINADHFCMQLRGVEQAHSSTRTTALRGAAKEDDSIKREFFQMLDVNGVT